ncbi:MAG: hypothetical protein CVT95_08450 [Bacteroidetes bacterium HGW-Bacteroidetes-12]|nr:MAG: hypothetical protein CVT95_08450 [Bacteroidetes bacterium HGW-Bacteroidetes-12]
MKKILIIGWVFTAIASVVLLYSVYGKLFNGGMIEYMFEVGVGKYVTLIAFGELVATSLFLIPATSRFGLLLLSAHMGGAIVIHLSNEEPFAFQSGILILIWLGGIFRNWERFR